MVATDDQLNQLRHDYESGTIGYGHAKQRLAQAIQDYFNCAHDRFNEFMSQPNLIQAALDQSINKVSVVVKTLILQPLNNHWDF